MADNISNNKRIVSNTLFLYIRMFLTMGITLYTSRVILKVLGIEDYGIYNVVAGFVSLMAFFQSSLINATQRFLNISLGKNDVKSANIVVSQSFVLYLIFSIFLIVLCEILGVWFLNNKLCIPEERLFAANIVLQFSLLSSVINILQVVYTANIIAREKMQFYAYVSILEVFLKLILVVALLYVYFYDKLILYSILYCLSSVVIFFVYKKYCNVHFEESHIKIIWNKQQVASLIRFISQNLYGCISWLLGSQGVNVVLNLFFGPSVNAAKGIATQVNGAVLRFTDNIMAAIRPQIVKSYANDDKRRMIDLIGIGTKLSYILFLLLAIPIYLNIEFILNLWLTDVPEHAAHFIRLMLIDTVINNLSIPLVMVSMSTGIIKRSQVWGKSFILLVLPVSYYLFTNDIILTPTLVFYLTILADICYFIYMLYDANVQVGISYWGYMKNIIIPLLIVSFLCFVITYNVILIIDVSEWVQLVVSIVTSTIFVILFTYIILLSNTEKEYCKMFILKKIKK